MMMRQHQAEIGKEFGLNIRASYCNEREIDIIGTKAKPKRKTLLERQVPEWSKRREVESGQRLPFGIKPAVKNYNINEAAQRTLDLWAKILRNRNGRNSCLSRCSPKTAARRSGMPETTPKYSAKRKRLARPLFRQIKHSH